MIKKVVNGEAKAVSRIYKGVKSECRLELDGSENWILYTSGTGWAGVCLADFLSSGLTRAAHYSNYFGFTQKGLSSRFIWVGVNNKYFFIVWAKGKPPVGYEHWEKNGDADIDAIKADLAKEHLIIWYDNTNSSVASMSALIPLIAGDTEKVKKVVDVTDQMTNSVKNYYWNAENKEWTGAHMEQKEYCHVGNAKPIIEKYGLQRYVIEFDGRSDVAGRIDLYSLSGGNYGYSIGNYNYQFTTDWQHYEIGFIPTILNNSTEGNCTISFYGNYGSGRVPHIKNFKIRTSVDVFTHVTSEVADGVMKMSPAEVADGVLTIKGDNVKVENNKLIIQ
nr:MAG TPA: putative glycosyl hydrolase family protein [Caudoviricetes sp.]